MARLVIRADDGNVWKRGDVVDVFEDGADIGDNVRNGARMPDGSVRHLFRIVDVSGPASAYRHLLEFGGEVDGKIVMRAKRVDVAAIEIADAGKKGRPLSKTEAVTLSASDLATRIADKAEIVKGSR